MYSYDTFAIHRAQVLLVFIVIYRVHTILGVIETQRLKLQYVLHYNNCSAAGAVRRTNNLNLNQHHNKKKAFLTCVCVPPLLFNDKKQSSTDYKGFLCIHKTDSV